MSDENEVRCVRCGKPKAEHNCRVGGWGACPVRSKDSLEHHWHPTDRFTPVESKLFSGSFDDYKDAPAVPASVPNPIYAEAERRHTQNAATPQYRELGADEVIEAGDEWTDDPATLEWFQVRHSIGNTPRGSTCKFRRRVTQGVVSATPTAALAGGVKLEPSLTPEAQAELDAIRKHNEASKDANFGEYVATPDRQARARKVAEEIADGYEDARMRGNSYAASNVELVERITTALLQYAAPYAEALKFSNCWLEAALDCKSFQWEGDQWAAADECRREANALLQFDSQQDTKLSIL